jgi:hypothetical protein
MSTGGPLYKRYGHFSDPEENSSAEERFARAEFAKISQEAPQKESSPSQKEPAQEEPSMSGAEKEKEEAATDLLVPKELMGYVQFIVFDTFFGKEAVKSIGPPDKEKDTPELYRDKMLFFKCQAESKVFEDFLSKHKERLFRTLQRTKFVAPRVGAGGAGEKGAKSLLAAFHGEMFKWSELHRVQLETAPRGARNVWNNETIPACTGSVHLILHPSQRDAKQSARSDKPTIVPSPMSIYVTRDQADLLSMCHVVYFFAIYMARGIYETSPEDMESKSFYDTWLYLTTVNKHHVHEWNYQGSNGFVKMVVHLRDILDATLRWL